MVPSRALEKFKKAPDSLARMAAVDILRLLRWEVAGTKVLKRKEPRSSEKSGLGPEGFQMRQPSSFELTDGFPVQVAATGRNPRGQLQ